MVSQLFLAMSLVGAEWVLWFLVATSIVSVAVIVERVRFVRDATRGLVDFREALRLSAENGRWEDAQKLALGRLQATDSKGQSPHSQAPDLETGLAYALLSRKAQGLSLDPGVLNELSRDQVVRARIRWEHNLSTLATIGANAPFVGLFGTVLGIIQAFHDLSTQGAAGSSAQVTAGMAEALVATAVGILVAIPAVVAFNLLTRRVKRAVAEAEALKSFLVGKLAG
jgi:biopolymer transport protein ExbB